MNNIFRLVIVLITLFRLHATAQDETLPFLHGLFTDNAVIQRDVKAPIWGWTTPGETVTVTIGDISVQAVAKADGLWMAHIGPFPAGGPHDIVISGKTNITLRNVLFGDVWLCSGQSNMEMGLGVTTNGEAEINAANYPKIRLFSVGHTISFTPVKTLTTNWFECSPTAIRQTANTVWGGFSAAAYFMGRDLHQELNVPIGLIAPTWGGTLIEPWMSEQALRKSGRFNATLDNRCLTVEEWIAKNDPGSDTNHPWSSRKLDDSDWSTMELPARWEAAGLPDYDGIVWFRRDIVVPSTWKGKDLLLSLGPIDDADATWFNGVLVGTNDGWTIKRLYTIPARLVKPGTNSVAIRVLDVSEGGGLFSKPEYLSISTLANTNASQSLAGTWRYKPGAQITPATPFPTQGQSGDANQPAVLYNGMIAPLVPYALKGFFWYQGESNAGEPATYKNYLLDLMADLRLAFHNPTLPGIIVQLPFFQPPQKDPVEDSGWTGIREAQLQAVRADSNMALVVTIDVGDVSDIHPPNKKDVGKRAALAALGLVYDKEIVSSGPLYRAMKVTTGGIRLVFDHAGTGLKTSDGQEVRGFAIAGDDGKFVFANAIIKGSEVLVSSPEVPHPTAVRYGWANNPNGNLVNSADLPASPFRTDAP